MLVEYKAGLNIISLEINMFSPWYSWKIAELALSNNHTLYIYIVCVCVRDIACAFFYEFPIGFWKCSDSVVFLFFILLYNDKIAIYILILLDCM